MVITRIRQVAVSKSHFVGQKCDDPSTICNVKTCLDEQRMAAEETLATLHESLSESYDRLCESCEEISELVESHSAIGTRQREHRQ